MTTDRVTDVHTANYLCRPTRHRLKLLSSRAGRSIGDRGGFAARTDKPAYDDRIPEIFGTRSDTRRRRAVRVWSFMKRPSGVFSSQVRIMVDKHISLRVCCMLFWVAVCGCGDRSPQSDPVAPAPEDSHRFDYLYDAALLSFLQIIPGTSAWSWFVDDAAGHRHAGPAELEIAGLGARWILHGVDWDAVSAEAGVADTLRLVPEHPGHWHSLVCLWADTLLTTLPPLPRQPVASVHYPDLLALLQELTADRFDGVVTHWPELPVPVRAGDAVCEDVDLAACLREAVDIWNQGEAQPLLVWSPHADWGVRLVHFPGIVRVPPLALRITRLDGHGSPLGMNLLAGDNYCSSASRPAARRGMIHELGHALLMWGHSLDRAHSLWGQGPPLVAEPSQDERRAVRLWNRLPVGLDLTVYDRPSP